LGGLRVLKTGGRFAFQDLFLMVPVYGDAAAVIGQAESAGFRKVELVDTARPHYNRAY
jgi:hypothetical protein